MERRYKMWDELGQCTSNESHSNYEIDFWQIMPNQWYDDVRFQKVKEWVLRSDTIVLHESYFNI